MSKTAVRTESRKAQPPDWAADYVAAFTRTLARVDPQGDWVFGYHQPQRIGQGRGYTVGLTSYDTGDQFVLFRADGDKVTVISRGFSGAARKPADMKKLVPRLLSAVFDATEPWRKKRGEDDLTRFGRKIKRKWYTESIMSSNTESAADLVESYVTDDRLEEAKAWGPKKFRDLLLVDGRKMLAEYVKNIVKGPKYGFITPSVYLDITNRGLVVEIVVGTKVTDEIAPADPHDMSVAEEVRDIVFGGPKGVTMKKKGKEGSQVWDSGIVSITKVLSWADLAKL